MKANESIFTAFADSAAARPEAPAVLGEALALTYAQLDRAARALAGEVARRTSAQRVGLYLPSSPAFAAAFLGTLAAGRTAVPLSLFAPPAALDALAEDAALDLVLTVDPLAGRLAPCRFARLDVAPILAGALADDEPGAPHAPKSGGDLAVILYTSGSSGAPKGVRLTHGNLLANTRGAAEAAGFSPDERVLAALPMFHTFALTTTLLAPLLAGGSVHTLARFSPEAVLRAIEKTRATVFLAVPSMLRLLARAQAAAGADLSSLRFVVSGGEGLPKRARDEFERATRCPICEGYGLTECSPVVALNRPEDNRPGTVGRPLPGTEVRVASDEGTTLAPGEEGEVQVRGPHVMAGYHNRPEETAAALTADGWLRTGDLGRLEADGYLSITGRLKELIIVAGENVAPAEVEGVLLDHPAVAEAAVVGVPDEARGETVVAFVVSPDALDARALRAHCRERLAPHKVPRRVETLAELPKGPTGKVLRKELAARAAGREE